MDAVAEERGGVVPKGLDEGRESGGRGWLGAAGRKAVGGVQRGNEGSCLFGGNDHQSAGK